MVVQIGDIMNFTTVSGLAAVVVLGLVNTVVAETSPPPPPPALAPTSIVGSGLNVNDLEAQKAWYIAMLGMTVTATYQRNGAPFEYVMGLKGPGGVLALLKAPRPTGPNGFGRVILASADAKALAQDLATHGVAMREVVPNIAYFITDPEGNAIELYTPPKS